MIATAITSSAILAECQPVAGQWCQRSSHPEMPATDLNPGSPRSAREEISLNIIEEAIDIFARMKSLTGEVTEHQMSLQCSNIHAFGIAQALHCNIQAGNLAPDLDVRDVLEEVYRIDCASRARTGINRYRTLKALMKMGLIDPNAHPKTLRPLNSVPRPEVVLAYIALKRNTAVSLIVDRGRRSLCWPRGSRPSGPCAPYAACRSSGSARPLAAAITPRRSTRSTAAFISARRKKRTSMRVRKSVKPSIHWDWSSYATRRGARKHCHPDNAKNGIPQGRGLLSNSMEALCPP